MKCSEYDSPNPMSSFYKKPHNSFHQSNANFIKIVDIYNNHYDFQTFTFEYGDPQTVNITCEHQKMQLHVFQTILKWPIEIVSAFFVLNLA